MGETYYEILEVEADASRDDIQAAYRERVLETHPDHNDAPDAAEQFKRVSTAKSVLTDGTERARYDRLGHDAYARLARRTARSSESNADESNTADASATDDSSESTTAGRRSGGHTSQTRTGTGRTRAGAESDRSGRTTSHHARQRNRRRRKTAQRRARSGWPFESDSRAASSAGTDTTAGGHADEDSASTFRYAVHDWDDDIDLERDGRPVDRTTAVTIGCLWVLYPVFVAASLTPLFPTLVNGIVAACALGLVGYLLTRPRVATLVFGSWSLLFPIGMVQTGVLTPFSVGGLVTLGFVWIPFGYALALWWALRP
ncbi:J domain-containing protein [Natronorubrum halophilum]|uniref:J domain-containing protein n=1 Tax=Natronorubrum halophilum TaxID=1702106 RepID=UPI0010C21B21|nr:DnaJ domain-containing protein [Natronorubrum halophilum]